MPKGSTALKLHGHTLISIISQMQRPTQWLIWGCCTHILMNCKMSDSLLFPSSLRPYFIMKVTICAKSEFCWRSTVGHQENLRQGNIYQVSMLIYAWPQGYVLSSWGNDVGEHTHWYKNFLFTSKWVSQNGCANVFQRLCLCYSLRMGKVAPWCNSSLPSLFQYIFEEVLCWRGSTYKNRIDLYIPFPTKE